ncbi:hypothetical protein UCREL1_4177 [Eutypa lata UCREL1]|uniref:FAD-binding domain-containing protein n=1 Tax=Eutypa lata (strain UCR-EL1) TaxID=1287681 RepID=M7TFS4_EUTLA|nr:hypothetical protein UCREL1_4177 [Eutypa lata UCREL1]
MTTAAPPTVLIIGSGVAGPVLAVLLKRKGYAPIVFEKVRALGDAGASLMLMPNGMKVLDLVGLNTTDLASSSTSGGAFPLDAFEDRSGGGSLLGSSALPSTFKAKYGQPAVGVKRTGLNLALKKMAEDAGIEVREGWALESVSEDSDADADADSSRSGRKTVTARFANGESVRGDFLIGCDGIKAASRDALQQLKNGASNQQQPPAFTGLTQTSGFSPAPAAFGIDDKSVMRNWFGEGVHVIAYPVSRTHVSWAVTLPEADEEAAKESWRIYGDDEREEVKRKLLSVLEETGFEPPVIEMVRSAERLLKFGLFDRQALDAPQWHTTRCVLAGDAAHPTSPHLGQGANQALEDCYHLSQALPDLTPRKEEGKVLDDDDNLEQIFAAYAEKRQPRTAALVRGARAAGQKRVVTTGSRDCEARNLKVAAEWKDLDAVAAKYDNLCREPFDATV